MTANRLTALKRVRSGSCLRTEPFAATMSLMPSHLTS